MTRRPKTRKQLSRKSPKRRPRRVDELRQGDIIWSGVSGRLFVHAVIPTDVDASGNLFQAGEEPPEPDAPKTTAYIIIAQRQTDGKTLQLGAYAPRALVDTVRSDGT